MNTKYDIGDTIYIPCKVSNITICSDEKIYYQVDYDKKKTVYTENELKVENVFKDPRELIKKLEDQKCDAGDIQHSTSFQFDAGINAAIKIAKYFFEIED